MNLTSQLPCEGSVYDKCNHLFANFYSSPNHRNAARGEKKVNAQRWEAFGRVRWVQYGGILGATSLLQHFDVALKQWSVTQAWI